MRPSRDAWILIGMLTVFAVVIVYLGTLKPDMMGDEGSTYSTSQEGAKAFFTALGGLGFKVQRHAGASRSLPKDVGLLFMLQPALSWGQGQQAVARWVRRGHTVVVASNNPYIPLGDLGVDVRLSRTNEEVSVKPMDTDYSTGVKSLWIADESRIVTENSSTTIISNQGDVIAEVHPLGKGRVIAFSDPTIFSNMMIRREDNFILLTNIVYKWAGKNGRVLFAEAEPGKAFPDEEGETPVVGRGGKLALWWLAFAVLAYLISAGRRFGTVHPLPEAEERRKGWEFVLAMAGLYRRAAARSTALSVVYQEFRRELSLKFGVSPTAEPAQVAESVLRARPIDRARLEAFIRRCEQVSGGKDISESEAVALARTIEEIRKELGIARSTHDSG